METCSRVKSSIVRVTPYDEYMVFSCIVTARKMTLDALESYKNPLLVITPDDEIVGFKHVYQTRLTKQTVGERGMRAPMGMWTVPETFIDNNIQLVINRLKEFY